MSKVYLGIGKPAGWEPSRCWACSKKTLDKTYNISCCRAHRKQLADLKKEINHGKPRWMLRGGIGE